MDGKEVMWMQPYENAKIFISNDVEFAEIRNAKIYGNSQSNRRGCVGRY